MNKILSNFIMKSANLPCTPVSVNNYSFSRCYCKIVVCSYVDSLVCRLGYGILVFAKKLIFKEFVRWELSLSPPQRLPMGIL